MTLFIGRLHILFVHFPIAFVLLAAALAVVGLARRRAIAALPLIVHVAAVSCVVTVGLGLLLFSVEDYHGETREVLEFHRLLGLIGTGLTIIASLLFVQGAGREVVKAALLLTASGVMTVGAHQGVVSTHGDDFLSFDTPAARRADPADDFPPLDEATRLSPIPEGMINFRQQIRPILEDKCIQCHGRKKQKGLLRLDSQKAAMHGSENGVIIVPGNAAESRMYKRITLPPGHEDVMPNKGDVLTAQQTDLIRDWIDQGAKWN
jgi:uncharacterized membrane protein